MFHRLFIATVTCFVATMLIQQLLAQSYPVTVGSSPTSTWDGYPAPVGSPYPTTSAPHAPYAPPSYSAVTPGPAASATTAFPSPTVSAPPVLPGDEPYTVSTPLNNDSSLHVAQVSPVQDNSPLLIDPNEQLQANSGSLLPPGTRQGVFQKVKFSATYLPQFESDSIGLTDLRSSLVFGLPFFTRETPIVIEPEYRVKLLEGPATPDLPARLHDAAVQFRHFRRVSDRWIIDGAVTLGVYADDHSFGNSDAFRITGRALGVYEVNDCWKWIFGVVYLNRSGTSVLPAVGVVHDTGNVKYELVFPRPRVAWMLPGSLKDRDEKWAYVMGEFGNGVWAVNRPATGTPDTLTTRDYRFIVGYERKIIGGLTSRFEIGYVFARELEFDSGAPADFAQDDTFLVRAGFSY